jgi:hypothetical protein
MVKRRASSHIGRIDHASSGFRLYPDRNPLSFGKLRLSG